MNLCQGWQQVLQYAGVGRGKKTLETLECHQMQMMLDSTNSGMKKEAENESLSGMSHAYSMK
jgi:hypothetical protein